MLTQKKTMTKLLSTLFSYRHTTLSRPLKAGLGALQILKFVDFFFNNKDMLTRMYIAYPVDTKVVLYQLLGHWNPTQKNKNKN
jgi:hypothetical protein